VRFRLSANGFRLSASPLSFSHLSRIRTAIPIAVISGGGCASADYDLDLAIRGEPLVTAVEQAVDAAGRNVVL